MWASVESAAIPEGRWLLEQLDRLQRGEAQWLERLAEFDASGDWAADGQLSCIDWLVCFARMGRSTAFDKLRVARQLRRRPVLASAFRDGRVTYCAVRAMCRAEDASAEVEEALVAVAEEGTVRDVELAVRTYRAYRDQELPPGEAGRRGLRLHRLGSGMTRLEAVLTDLEAERVADVLGTLSRQNSQDGRASLESSREDGEAAADGAGGPPADGAGAPPAEPSREDWWDRYEAASQAVADRRADALMEAVDLAALALAAGAAGADAEQYLTHIVIGPDGTATLADGTAIRASEAQAAGCDSGWVCHHHDSSGRPLFQGRRSHTWSVAQRREALVRDGRRCRFPGCGRSTCHLHHLHWWSRGGATDIDNGALLCRHHHTLVHEGDYAIAGEPGGLLRFYAAGGRLIGATRPVRRTLVAAVR